MANLSPVDAGHKLTEIIQSVFYTDLAAVILYGSAATGVYRSGVSDINLLVILEKSSPQDIFEAGKKAAFLVKKYRLNPLFMTREEFMTSADVFPMEYGDIKDAHLMIFGDKQILDISLNRKNLRFQLEEKLRGAVNDIRHMLFSVKGNKIALRSRLLRWTGAGTTLFRNLLRLKGSPVPQNSDDVLKLVSKEYNIGLDSFSALNRLKQKEKTDLYALADSLLETLKALTKIVDDFSEAGNN